MGILVGVLMAAALAYLLWRAIKIFRGESGCDCCEAQKGADGQGKCAGCRWRETKNGGKPNP